MKRIRFASAMVLFLWGTLGIAVAQLLTWEREYGAPNRAELAWDIVESPDHNFVICGITIGSLAWDLDGWIICINSRGDVLWTKQIGSQGLGAGQDFLTCVILNDRNELVLTGNRYQFPQGKQVWWLKFNLDGELLTEKRYGGSGEDNGHKIIQNQDGSYLLIGDTESFGTQQGGKDIWVLKLNAEGDTLWTRTYDLGAVDMATGIIHFKNNQYLLTAVSITADGGGIFQQGFATYLVIDSAGTVLKTRTFAESPKNKFLDVSPTDNGGAIITGGTSSRDHFPSEDIWLVKLDGQADTVWTKTLGSYGRYDGGHSIFQSVDGGYYLAAYSQTYQSPQMDFDNWWLLKLNAAGDTLWTRWWGGPLNDDPYSIIPTSDSGIVMAGWRDANSNPFYSISIGDADFYIIKTDPQGVVSAVNSVSSLSPVSFDLRQNYPNPFNSKTTIGFQSSASSHVTLKIFDLLGREVTTLVDGVRGAGWHQIAFDAAGLPSGSYLYRLTTPVISLTKTMELVK
jgi:hypothetical protein